MSHEKQRYTRQIILPEMGEEGQGRLSSARLLCVGAGGLGCPALLYLAAAGIGHMTVIDPDDVDVTNLQRQILFQTSDIGKKKALTAKEHLKSLNPDIDITAIPEKLNAKNAVSLFEKHDLIIDGTDNFSAKFLINDAAVKTGKPVVFGAIQGCEGQVCVFDSRASSCYRCLYPHFPQAQIQNCAEAGVIGAIAGIVGTMQAMQAIELIVGSEIFKPLVGKLWSIDVRTMEVSTFSIPKNADCPVCHLPKSQIELRPEESICLVRTIPQIDFIDQNDHILLDVREEHEYRSGFIPQSVNWSLSRMESGDWPDLQKNRDIIVYCQKGIRSLRAAELLMGEGFLKVTSLAGGYEEWRIKSNL